MRWKVAFRLPRPSRINFHEYTSRIVATLRMYREMGDLNSKNLHILSFRKIESTDPVLQQAQAESGTLLFGPIYSFEVFRNANAAAVNNGLHQFEDFDVSLITTLLIGTSEFLLRMIRVGDGSQARSPWSVVND